MDIYARPVQKYSQKQYKTRGERKSMGANSRMEYAFKYLSLGLSVIPVKPHDKTPLVRWEEYQRRKPSENEIREWFTKNPEADIAVVCGKVSGNLIVLDFDDKAVFQKWLESLSDFFKNVVNHTWVVETEKGIHIYLRLKEPELLPRTKVKLLPGLVLKAEGDYVIAPTSIDADRVQIITLNKREWELFKSFLGYNESETPAITSPIVQQQIQPGDIIGVEVDLSKPLLPTPMSKPQTGQETPPSITASQPQPTPVQPTVSEKNELKDDKPGTVYPARVQVSEKNELKGGH
jgi:hypothetical protein